MEFLIVCLLAIAVGSLILSIARYRASRKKPLVPDTLEQPALERLIATLEAPPEQQTTPDITTPEALPEPEPAPEKLHTRAFFPADGLAVEFEYVPSAARGRRTKAEPLEKAGDSCEFMVRGGTKPTRNGPTKRMRLYPLLSKGQRLRLVREPENPDDANAVLIYPADGRLETIDLGYAPAHVAAWLAPMLDRGGAFDLQVSEVMIRGINGQWPSLYVELRMIQAPEPEAKRTRKRKAPAAE